MSRAWFSYTGPIGGELNSTRYNLTPIKPTCFEGTPNVCVVYAISQPESYGTSPSPFSNNLLTYIAALKATSNAQPLGRETKKYVYSFPQ